MRAVAFLCCAFLLAGHAVAAAPPLEAYGQLPTLSDFALSPDGKTIAFARGDEANRFVVVEEIGAPKPLSVLAIHDQKLRALEWADDNNLIIVVSTTTLPVGLIGNRGELATAQYLDVRTNTVHPLLAHIRTNDALTALNVIEGMPHPRIIDGHTVVFVRGIYFPENSSRYALFSQDITANEPARMVSRFGDTVAENWLVDSAGNIAAETDYYEPEKHWVLKIYRNGDSTKPIDVDAPIEGPDLQGFTADGSGIVVKLPDVSDVPQYEQIALKDGSVSPWQYADFQFTNGLYSDPRNDRVIGAPAYSDQSDYVYFNKRAEDVWLSVKAAFRNATDVKLISRSEDWSRVVVLVFGPGYGAGYFLVDMSAHKADPIGNLYDGIEEISPQSWITYRAADGRPIHAYLTLPLGRDPRNLPLVVLPHGGPHSRDEPGFDWISQAIASRGYAVLQPQFRGSDGFGKDLLWAGFGEFGRKMQTDLSDGVRALAGQGLIDPKRVCIVGASYGGYAALAGATLDTGVYRCAVADAGISDLHALLARFTWPLNPLDARNTRFWDRFLAVSSPNDPKLDAISPIKHVDKVSIPILLIHGRDDTVVPFAQSEDMAEALRTAGKKVEFVELAGEDHWLSRSATRIQMLAATIKFLEENNPPDGGGIALGRPTEKN